MNKNRIRYSLIDRASGARIDRTAPADDTARSQVATKLIDMMREADCNLFVRLGATELGHGHAGYSLNRHPQLSLADPEHARYDILLADDTGQLGRLTAELWALVDAEWQPAEWVRRGSGRQPATDGDTLTGAVNRWRHANNIGYDQHPMPSRYRTNIKRHH